MTAGLRPWVTRGSAARIAAWDRLAAGSRRFRRLEAGYSLIWGAALLADCAARLAGAFILPVPTMAWLGTALTLGAIGLAIVVGGLAAGPMLRLVDAAARRPAAGAPQAGRAECWHAG